DMRNAHDSDYQSCIAESLSKAPFLPRDVAVCQRIRIEHDGDETAAKRERHKVGMNPARALFGLLLLRACSTPRRGTHKPDGKEARLGHGEALLWTFRREQWRKLICGNAVPNTV